VAVVPLPRAEIPLDEITNSLRPFRGAPALRNGTVCSGVRDDNTVTDGLTVMRLRRCAS
jgi:hypothetical protein